jgi:putative FmdB family regulatory protein
LLDRPEASEEIAKAMPIYEYRCAGCECEFEELVSSSTPGVSCPECGSRDVERLLSTF